MSNSSQRARRSPARNAALLSGAALTALTLSACVAPPNVTGDDAPVGVGFEDVQSAVIQLEARGTFVDPSYGGYEGAGRGSGFLISDTGLALTNNHVVVGAGTIDVWRGGDQSETLNARVLGSSECLDLAVVQLEEGDYPFLSWRKGDITTATEVFSAGFPLGEPEFTLTSGIVSKASTYGNDSWANVDTVIEHDARIRPGNSGGPLVDTDGRVLGVNYAGNDEYDYNWAIHRDEVLDVLDTLIAGENVLSLGINAQAIRAEDGTGLGIWVSSVAAGSIADKAGVEPGDLLTRMQGVSLGTEGTLSEYCDVLRTHGQDATLDVELYRPADGLYHRGQFNGDPIEPVTVLGNGNGGNGGNGGTDEDYVGITDASGAIYVEVPTSWSQVDGASVTDGSGNTWASVQASADLTAYRGGWSTPGATVMASPGALANTTVEDLIGGAAGMAAESGCTSEQRDEYADGYHTGEFEYFTGCGAEGASYIVVAAVADSGNYLVYVAVQANTDADLDAVDRVLGSFIAEF